MNGVGSYLAPFFAILQDVTRVAVLIMNRRLILIVGLVVVLLLGIVMVLQITTNRAADTDEGNSTQSPAASDNKTKSEVKVYYTSIGNVAGSGTLVGCNDGLVEKRVLVDGLTNDIKQAYEQELSLGMATEPGLYNALARSKLTIQEVRVENGTALVNLSGELLTIDSCDRARVRAQLESSALQFDGVSGVVVRVNGYLLEELFR